MAAQRGAVRGGPGRRLLPVAAVVAISTLFGTAPAGAAVRPAGQVPGPGTIRAEQLAVVNLNHQVPIGEASFAVSGMQARLAADRQALASAQGAASSAGAELAAATSQLQTDQAGLQAATTALDADQVRLDSDRQAVKGIAIALYTGELTNPQPAGLHALVSDQLRVIDTSEMETVTALIGQNLQRDLARYGTDGHRRAGLAQAVTADGGRQRAARGATVTASSQTGAAAAAVAADGGRLAAAQAQLGQAQAALTADLAAVSAPPETGGLSVIGGAALDASELASWYTARGYSDLTTAPIGQLARWYIQAGQQEGIRGDVAFAQAVLETGGFGSPDSVQFNNYAGIGHCDSCSSGWDFPSPQGGVLGQEQLLRIFADGRAPAGGPAPVLPSLAPADQGSRACCSTWQSLTGVWATDPTYGTQIMSIYAQMLSFVLTGHVS